jgi:hypothetical protein
VVPVAGYQTVVGNGRSLPRDSASCREPTANGCAGAACSARTTAGAEGDSDALADVM